MQAGRISLDAGEQGAGGETAVAPKSVDADGAGTSGGVGDIGDGGELRRALRRRNVTYTEVDIWTTGRGHPRAVNNLALQSLVAVFASGKNLVDAAATRSVVTEVVD